MLPHIRALLIGFRPVTVRFVELLKDDLRGLKRPSNTQDTEDRSGAALKRAPGRRGTVGAAFAKQIGEAAEKHQKSGARRLQSMRPYLPAISRPLCDVAVVEGI